MQQKNKGEDMISKISLKKFSVGLAILTITAVVALSFCACGKKSNSEFSADNFKQTDQVQIVVKNYGTIKVGLDANAAPITVQNFKDLINEGFYNGLTFHRIINQFMAQGGDPKGDGTGGSQKTIKGEFKGNGVNNFLAHTRGAISMAKSSDPNSASSQFFIVHQTSQNNSKSLDGKYACFGYVTEGMDVVDKIIADAKPTDDNGTIAKEQQPVIESISII